MRVTRKESDSKMNLAPRLELARARMLQRLKRRVEIDEEIVVDMNRPLPEIEYSILKALVESVTSGSQQHTANATNGTTQPNTNKSMSSHQLVNHLKYFSRYCAKRFNDRAHLEEYELYEPILLTDRDILFSLRLSLFHDSSDVRSATLRAIRHFIRISAHIQALLSLNIHHLIIRSLDLILDNHTERTQALRLIRHIMAVDPQRMPLSLARCLCAIVESVHERDSLIRPAMATIAEMAIINPKLADRSECIRAMLQSAIPVAIGLAKRSDPLHHHQQQQARQRKISREECGLFVVGGQLTSLNISFSSIVLLEAILASFIYLCDWPDTRRLVLKSGDNLDVFLAPFTDQYSFLQATICASEQLNKSSYDGLKRAQMIDAKYVRHQQTLATQQNPKEERMLRYSACRYALLSLLRSWPGLFLMCRQNQSVIKPTKKCSVSAMESSEHHYGSNGLFTEDDYNEIYHQPNVQQLQSLQDSLRFFGIHDIHMPRRVTQLVSGVGKAMDSSSARTSSFFSARSYEIMNGIESLIGILHVPYPEVHLHILELLFDIFGLRMPEVSMRETFDDCMQYTYFSLLAKRVRHQQQTREQSKNFYPSEWQLYDGFVAKEAEHILSARSGTRLSYVVVYLALLLQSLIEHGLIEALVSVILDSFDIECVNLATILLAETIHLTGRYLPASNYAHKCASLPSLVAASVCNLKSRRSRALEAIANLNEIHELKKLKKQPASLFLEQQIHFARVLRKSTSLPRSSIVISNNSSSHSRRANSINKAHDDMIIQQIKQSQVIKKVTFKDWHWETVADILRHPGEALRRLDDKDVHRVFVRRLLEWLKPSQKNFSNVSKNVGSSSSNETSLYTSGSDRKELIYVENPKQLGVVAMLFIDYLLDADEMRMYEFVEELLIDLDAAVRNINPKSSQQSTISSTTSATSSALAPSRLHSTLSYYYFLLIGRMTHSHHGRRWLERTQIKNCSLELCTLNEIYAKLLCSSLDFGSDDQFSRGVLRKIMTSASDSIRLYGTQFMRVLLRVNIPNFEKWAIEFLINQLMDQSEAVALMALDVLDEACATDDQNEKNDSNEMCKILLRVISSRAPILHLGDAGIVFMARFASFHAGLAYLRQTNMLEYELKRWKEMFTLRYVRLVEDSLNEMFTHHHRGVTGMYGRRSERNGIGTSECVGRCSTESHAPPHLYGQLAKCDEGLEILKSELVVNSCCDSIHQLMLLFVGAAQMKKPNEVDTLRLKAALWSIGHVMSCAAGIQLVVDSGRNVIQHIAILAKQATVVSVRATSFMVMCLISCTETGGDLMRLHGWIPIQHSPDDAFPINQQEYDNFYYDGRPRFMSNPEPESEEDEEVDEEEDDDDDGDVQDEVITDNKDSVVVIIDDENVVLVQNTATTIDSIQSSFTSVHSLDTNTSSLGCLEMSMSTNVPQSSAHNRPRSSSDHAKTLQQQTLIQQQQQHKHQQMVKRDQNRKISAPCMSSVHQNTKGGRCDSNESANTAALYSSTSGVESRSTSFAEYSTTTSSSRGQTNDDEDEDDRTNNDDADGFRKLSAGTDTSKRKKRKMVKKKRKSTNIPPQMGDIDDPYPSPMDAHGYAQLRAISKQRVQSLAVGSHNFAGVGTKMDDSGTGFSHSRENILDDLAGVSGVACCANSATVTGNTVGSGGGGSTRQRKISSVILPSFFYDQDKRADDHHHHHHHHHHQHSDLIQRTASTFRRSHSYVSRKSMDSFISSNSERRDELYEQSVTTVDVSGDEVPKPKHYLCLALPETLANLFHFDENYEVALHVPNTRECPPNSTPLLKRSYASSDYLKVTVTDDGDGLVLHRPSKCIVCCYVISDANGQQVSAGHMVDASVATQRRELFNLIALLGATINMKQNEQLILDCKNDHPSLFEDYCLYSEVCLMMEQGHFRAHARRFIHELFLDCSASLIYKKAELMLANMKKPASMNAMPEDTTNVFTT